MSFSLYLRFALNTQFRFRHGLAEVQCRWLALLILKLKALFKLFAHLLLDRIDRLKRERTWVGSASSSPVVDFLWQYFTDLGAALTYLKLVLIQAFYCVAGTRRGVAIVVTLLLLVCRQMLALVASTHYVLILLWATCHSWSLAQHGRLRFLVSIRNSLIIVIELARFRLVKWRTLTLCSLFNLLHEALKGELWRDLKIFVRLVFNLFHWDIVLDLCLTLNDSCFLKFSLGAQLAKAPFLFLLLSVGLLELNRCIPIRNCLDLKGEEKVFVSRNLHTKLFLRCLCAQIMELSIILVLHVLLQKSIFDRLWAFLNRFLRLLVESCGLGILLQNRLIEQGWMRLSYGPAGVSRCVRLQSEVLWAHVWVI